MPEVVRTGDDGLKSIEYQDLVGLLIVLLQENQEPAKHKCAKDYKFTKRNIKRITTTNY
jgi:hypothetical protein